MKHLPYLPMHKTSKHVQYVPNIAPPPPTSFIIFHFQKNTYIPITQVLCHSLSICPTAWCQQSHTTSVLSQYTVTDMSLTVHMPHSLVSSQSHHLSIITVCSHWHVTHCPYAPQPGVITVTPPQYGQVSFYSISLSSLPQREVVTKRSCFLVWSLDLCFTCSIQWSIKLYSKMSL